jgi:hypothetical protein
MKHLLYAAALASVICLSASGGANAAVGATGEVARSVAGSPPLAETIDWRSRRRHCSWRNHRRHCWWR